MAPELPQQPCARCALRAAAADCAAATWFCDAWGNNDGQLWLKIITIDGQLMMLMIVNNLMVSIVNDGQLMIVNNLMVSIYKNDGQLLLMI